MGTAREGVTAFRNCTTLDGAAPVRRDVWVEAGRIIAPPAGGQPDVEVDASGCLAFPALVNPHVHLGETLLRGALDVPTLERYIALSHGSYASDQWWRDRGAIRAASEDAALYDVIMSGTGTVCTSRSWEAVTRVGLRGLCGYPLCRTKKLQRYYDAFPAEFLARLDADEPGGLCRTVLYIQSLPAVDMAALETAAELYRSGRLEAPFFVHLHESSAEVAHLKRRYGVSGVHVLDRLGLLGPWTLLVHCVWVTEDELDLIAERGAAVVLCPVANMRLRVGLPPFSAVARRKIRWALGTDGLAANDSAQPLETAKLAALVSGLELPPRYWLDKVTCDAAAVLGLGDETGRLQPGFSADIALFELDPGLSPAGRLASNMLYNWPALRLRSLYVRGRVVAQGGQPCSLDRPTVARTLDELHRALFS
jgi:5-methylthioadenosine/S-adenosylhomocysteine deaminase